MGKIADWPHGACLRTDIAFVGLNDKFDRIARMQTVKISVDNAVAMKIDQALIGGHDLAVSLIVLDFGDLALERSFMCLHITADLVLPAFQFLRHRGKRIAHSHPQVFMSGSILLIEVYHKFGTGHAHLDGDLLKVTSALAAVWRPDIDVKTCYTVIKGFQMSGLFCDKRLDFV